MIEPIDGIRFREDPAQYGTMPPEDAAYLRNEIIGKWSDRDRKLLGNKGFTVVLGDRQWTAPSGPKEIYISKSELDAHRQYPNSGFPTTVKFLAFQNTLGNGPSSINWDGVKEELLLPLRRNLTLPGLPESALRVQHMNLQTFERNLNGPNAVAFILAAAEKRFQGRELSECRKQNPALVAVYEQYLRFIAEQIVEMEPVQKSSTANLLTLENGTREQKQMFEDACAALSPDVIKVLIDKGIHFSIGNVPLNVNISGKNVVLGEKRFKSPGHVEGLSPLIFGYGLATALKPGVDSDLLRKAYDENVDRTFLNYDKSNQQIQQIIAVTKNPPPGTLSLTRDEKLGDILAGAHVDLNKADQSTFAHIIASRREVYNRYMEAVTAHIEGKPQLHAERNTAPEPDYYTYSPNLPAPEKRFFAALEKVRRLTHGKHGEFEYNIRGRLQLLLYNTPVICNEKLTQQINHDYNTNIDANVQTENAPHSNLSGVLRSLPISVSSAGTLVPGGIKGSFDTINMATELMNGFANRFDRLFHQRLSTSGELYHPEVARIVEAFRQQLGGRVQYEYYNPDQTMFEAYSNGSRSLHEISGSPASHQWQHYNFNLPSERTYLLSAMLEAARLTAGPKNLNANQRRELELGLKELSEAFNDAVLSPTEREAQERARHEADQRTAAEAERLRREREAEEARKRQEALLPFIAYGVPSGTMLQSIKDRATRQNPPPPGQKPPEKELADAWAQIKPLTEELNRNFAPHLAAGNALFQDHDGQTLSILNYVATGKFIPDDKPPIDHPNFPQRHAQIRNMLISTLADPLETIMPQLEPPNPDLRNRLIEINRSHHEKVLTALTNAPLLLIAAFGAPNMMLAARKWQKDLFPEAKGNTKPKPLADTDPELAEAAQEEIRYLAGRAVRYGFEQAGRQIPPALAAALPVGPPAPPGPPPAIDRGHTPDWDEVQQRVIDFLTRTLQESVGEGRPFTLFRCRIDRGEPGGDTPHLRVVLSRWIPEPGGARLRPDHRTLDISLGNTPLETALQWRHDIQDMVMQQRPFLPDRKLHVPAIVNFIELILPNIPPNLQRLEQKDGVWQLYLRFEEQSQTAGVAPHITETYIPLGLPQGAARPDDRAQDVLNHLAEMRQPTEGGEHIITAPYIRGWIENHIRAANQPWQGAETLRLDPPAVASVDFPAAGSAQIEINRYTLKGTPTGDWKVPMAFYRMIPNGHGQNRREKIYSCEFNTHRGTAEGARACIPQILSHMKRYLEAYGNTYRPQHPNVGWHLNQGGTLDQYDVGHEGANVDKTKLDWMLHSLEYPCGFTVQAVDTTRYEGHRAVGRPTFRLEVLQPDNVPFRERSVINRDDLIPLRREFRINEEKLGQEEVQRRITECRNETQRLFSQQLCARFSPRQNGDAGQPANDEYETIPVHFPPADTGWQAVHEYRPQTVRNLFKAAYEAYAPTHGIEELPHTHTHGPLGDGDVQPADPVNYRQPTPRQREDIRGFEHRVGRRGANRAGVTPEF